VEDDWIEKAIAVIHRDKAPYPFRKNTTYSVTEGCPLKHMPERNEQLFGFPSKFR
jgi:hypothetical protein